MSDYIVNRYSAWFANQYPIESLQPNKCIYNRTNYRDLVIWPELDRTSSNQSMYTDSRIFETRFSSWISNKRLILATSISQMQNLHCHMYRYTSWLNLLKKPVNFALSILNRLFKYTLYYIFRFVSNTSATWSWYSTLVSILIKLQNVSCNMHNNIFIKAAC